MRFGVVRFPGSCDDVDAQLAAARAGEAVLLWHADRDLQGAVGVPEQHGLAHPRGGQLRIDVVARAGEADDARPQPDRASRIS